MSAPDTNTRKQASRHRPALIGIVIAVLLGGLFFGLNILTAIDDDEVQGHPAGVSQDAPPSPADPVRDGAEPVTQ
ncbi:hypothetical protein I5535_12190 [Rhodobacteraceae bacterium F11138]|nr:hypothetical protein [Rhodobacteraceae bacterium F11138]